ncbi:MAG: Holliday junction branch migration protein RuvA [Balneolaceae bacterium]|nr:MAG: Holliday junction branch migration protein RuvA [Balneolaceae bacterium]
MIAYLKGKLVFKASTPAIIEVNGIGYEVFVSTETLSRFPAEGREVTVFTHHHFAEADQKLYGFVSRADKSFFELLITVKGIGPKIALGIMSGASTEQISEAIYSQDIPRISSFPGIGKKSAERIILELKDKIGSVADGARPPSAGGPSSTLHREAVSALESLGYRKAEAEKTVSALLRTDGARFSDVSDVIRTALKSIHK